MHIYRNKIQIIFIAQASNATLAPYSTLSLVKLGIRPSFLSQIVHSHSSFFFCRTFGFHHGCFGARCLIWSYVKIHGFTGYYGLRMLVGLS